MTTALTKPGTRFYESVEWRTETCYKCGVPFAFTTSFYLGLKRDKGTFHCPNGHPQAYVKSTEEVLRQQIVAKEAELRSKDYAIQCAREETEKAKRREQIAAGEAKRVMNRMTSGVCPCCNRFFENVSRHMKSKHGEMIHEAFVMTEEERGLLVDWPQCQGARGVRRRFVRCHSALTNEQIAKMMIDGKMYASKDATTVAKAVQKLR